MAVHASMTDPPDYTADAAFACPKCGETSAPLTYYYSNTYVLNDESQITKAIDEGVTQEDDWLARVCIRCTFTFPERTVDNPR